MQNVKVLKALLGISVLVIVALVIALPKSENSKGDLSAYRAKYAKPINEWEEPNIDESVKDWEEFAPVSRPKVPDDNQFVGAKAHLGRNLFNDPLLPKKSHLIQPLNLNADEIGALEVF